MAPTKDFPELEVLAKKVGTGERALREDRPVPKIHIHDSLLGKIKEIKFLLRKS